MAVHLQDIPQQERWNKIREILQENFNLLNLAIGTGGGGDIDLTGIATEQYVDEKDSKLRDDLMYAVLKPAAALMANKDGKGRVIDETYLLKEELKTLLSGKINLSSKSEVTKAQKLLTQTNEVAFYLVTDSSGKIPSSQSCYNIPSDIVKQLSLTSPNSVTNAALALATSSTTLDAVGVNVGDLVALTRVKVKVSDLTATLGINLSLSGEIEMYQYKVLSMNDAKPTGHSQASAGVMGLMSPWDKGQVNKIATLETASAELNRGNKKTMFTADNYNIDQCLDGGIYLYGRTGRSMAGNHSDEYYIVSVDTRYNRSDSKYYVTQRVYSVNYKNRAFERLIITSATNNYNGTYNDWIQLTEEQYMSEGDVNDFVTIRNWYNSVVGTDSDKVINKWSEIVAFLNNIPEGDTLDGIITALNTGLDNLEEKHTQEIDAVNGEIADIKDGTTKVFKAYVADNVGDLSAEDIQSFIDDSTELFEGIPNTYAQKGEALKSAGISVSQGTDKATIILEGQYADGTVLNPSSHGVDIPAATTSKAGLMSSDMLKKIDNIQLGVGDIPIIQMLQEDAANQILIPYMQNDIAYPIARGGYIKMWKDGVESALTDTICNGLPDYVDVRGATTSVSEIVIEIDANKALPYSQRVYIAFSSSLLRAKSIKLETKVAAADEWIVIKDVTDFSGSAFFSKLPTTDATPYRYLRFTLSNFNSKFCRISDIGVASYNSKGLQNIVLSKGGGEMYGSITPYKDNSYNLGGITNSWRGVNTYNLFIKRADGSRSQIFSYGNNILVYSKEGDSTRVLVFDEASNSFRRGNNAPDMILGTSTYPWKTVYADTFQGKATVAADVEVANNVASEGDRPLIWAGGTVGNSSNSGATDLYKSYGDLSYNPSTKTLKTGEVVLGGTCNVKTEIENAKTEIDKKSNVIDVTALFTSGGTIAGLTHDMLCKATLYAQGTGGDGGAPVRFYPYGELNNGIATNPLTGYLVAEAISSYEDNAVTIDKCISTITIGSSGATCKSVETRYGEL